MSAVHHTLGEIVEITTCPHLETDQIVTELEAGHVATHVISDADTLVLGVDTQRESLFHDVFEALERLIAKRALPLVVQPVGSAEFVVRPPAG